MNELELVDMMFFEKLLFIVGNLEISQTFEIFVSF